MRINENYRNIQDSYLFSAVGKKVAAYSAAHPDKSIIRLGIGDVTRPLCPAVTEAMQKAALEMGTPGGFHGYIPSEQGYPFLREAIARYYAKHGVVLSIDEIFISDGAKSDLGNLLDLFAQDNTVLIPDPVYPAYVDVNVMAGRKIVYCDANAENGFLPLPDENVQADLIYICSPNNPTGAVYDHAGLKKWVDYALRQDAIILFDAAYEAFITDPSLPRSIYEIEGAKQCAIEICSLSKTAGFTGTRWLHHCARGAGTRRHELKPHVAAPPDHQIQRHGLHRAARSRSGLYRRRLRPVHGKPRLLPPQRPRHGRYARSARYFLHRRRQLALYLAALPR